MGGLKRIPWLFGPGVLLAVLVVSGGYARADVTTDQPGSIIVFPKVISDGTRDTLITISNTGNMPAIVHCIYNNSPSGFCNLTTTQACRFDQDCPGTETCQLTTPGVCSVTSTQACSIDTECPEFETCVHQCVESNFDLILTGQQPTVWDVARGRVVDPSDEFPGLDPGSVPFKVDFVGELKCYTIDESGAPIAQNSLTGKACIYGQNAGADLSEYSAVTVFAKASPAKDLNLDNTEYNACPANVVLDHWSAGSGDAFTQSLVSTELTLVPCTEDFENQLPPPGRAIFDIYNEFEEHLSASIDLGCYFNRRLSDIGSVFLRSSIRTDFAKTRITPSSSKVCYTGTNRGNVCSSDTDCPGFLTSINGTNLGCLSRPGLLAVSEEFYERSPRTNGISVPAGTAAANVDVEGNRGSAGGDVIVLPLLQTP
jgi:hypothetical protein